MGAGAMGGKIKSNMKTTTPQKKITLDQARKVLEIVDAGLSHGLGTPEPGKMCVEAAVCFALGQTHGDDPACVSPAVRAFKITLNDSSWSSPQARAKGMRRIAIAQLGTAGEIDEKAFATALAEQTVRQIVPIALRAAASLHHDPKHKEALEAAALKCETEGSDAARAASDAASYAARYAASDAASYAASYAASAARHAASDAASAARAASYAASAARAASDAASDAARAASYAASAARDKTLTIAAEIGVQALRVVGAAGVALMDKLIK